MSVSLLWIAIGGFGSKIVLKDIRFYSTDHIDGVVQRPNRDGKII